MSALTEKERAQYMQNLVATIAILLTELMKLEGKE